MNRRSGVKMFLSVITAPIVLAQQIDILIRQCNVNQIFILQIRSAMPIYYLGYKHVRANTIGGVKCHISGQTGLVLLAQIRSASPIRRDNAYL